MAAGDAVHQSIRHVLIEDAGQEAAAQAGRDEDGERRAGGGQAVPEMNRLWLVRCEEGLTENYHSGGAMIVCAPDRAEALRIFHANRSGKDVTNDETGAEAAELIVSEAGAVAVLPDAGCC